MTEAEWLSSTDPRKMLDALPMLLRCDDEQTPDGCGLSKRKLRLFACAVIRSWRGIFAPDNIENFRAIVAAEEYADGLRKTLPDVHVQWVGEWCTRPDADMTDSVRAVLNNHEDGIRTAAILRDIAGNPFRPIKLPMTFREVERKETRRIPPGAHPMVPVSTTGKVKRREFYCPWFTSNVSGMARHIYEERDFALMPQLGDVLEEVGCPSDELIPCPICSPYRSDPENRYGPGYRPERDPASGRYEGGWSNCKQCNGGGKGCVRAGFVMEPHPVLAHLRSTGPHCRGCYVLDALLGKE